MKSSIHLALAAVLLFQACSGGPPPGKEDTTTTGRARIVADVDLKALVEAQRTTFEGLYRKAGLDISYLSEQEVLQVMADDSVRCSITCILPGADQETRMQERRVLSRPIPVCVDGIAVVCHPSRPLGSLRTTQLQALLDASVTSPPHWGTLEGGSDLRVPTLLFAGHGSGVARTLMDSLHLGGLRASALPDVDAVLRQVAQDPNTIGLIPFNSISDLDDPAMRARREGVKLLPIEGPTGGGPVLPNQSTLAAAEYPLRRMVYMVLTEGRSGLGTGFVSFVANHKGQRIFLKRGVAPIKVPAREVEIVHE